MTRYRFLQTPVFEGLVDELLGDADAAGDDVPRPASATVQGDALWSINAETTLTSPEITRSSAYAPDAFSPDPAPLPSKLPIDTKSIFAELGLKPGLTAYQVRSLRRNFARNNHPDRFPIELQANATERMMIANALCDAYPLTAS